MRDVLKARRLELGMTQAEVAAQLGKIRTFVSKYEKGDRILTFTEVVEICKLMGLDISQLVEGVYQDDQDSQDIELSAAEDEPFLKKP